MHTEITLPLTVLLAWLSMALLIGALCAGAAMGYLARWVERSNQFVRDGLDRMETEPSLVEYFHWSGSPPIYPAAYGHYNARCRFTPIHGPYAGVTLCVSPADVRSCADSEVVKFLAESDEK